MAIKPTSTAELTQIIAETFFNKTTKVTKISDDSVLGGIFYGCAKVGQKALKDIALATSHLFPDDCNGDLLDRCAAFKGIAPRFTSSTSSVYVRLLGDAGTTYTTGTHRFSGSNGVQFDLDSTIVMPDDGVTYAKLRSVNAGLNTTVDALTISKVLPVPVGHKYVINEFAATGGRDVEQDDLFRQRIKQGINALATGTLSKLEQAFIAINNNVLRIYYQGTNELGQTQLAVAAQNGINFTAAELADMLDRTHHLFSFTDLRPNHNKYYGVMLVNIEYYPIDVSFRCDLKPNFNPDDVRKAIQQQLNRLLDFRYWDGERDVLDWTNLLDAVKKTAGVKSVPSTFFTPNLDVEVPLHQLPRLRGFLMLNLDGQIIRNATGTLNPVYYPSAPDFKFQQTLLRSIAS